MDEKQRNEWLDLFAEAFQGVVVPYIKQIERGIKDRFSKVEYGLSKVESEVLDFKFKVKDLKESVDEVGGYIRKQDQRLGDHENRIMKLEQVASH